MMWLIKNEFNETVAEHERRRDGHSDWASVGFLVDRVLGEKIAYLMSGGFSNAVFVYGLCECQWLQK